MSVKWSLAVRNAILDTYESTIGASPYLQLFSGTIPADCAAADTGTLLAEIPCPADWMAAASSGQKIQAGAWSSTGLAAAGSGTNITHYRLKNNAKAVCHDQGTVTVTNGGGDLTIDNTNIAQNQQVSVSSWTKIAPHA